MTKIEEIQNRLDAAHLIVNLIIAAATKQSPSVSLGPTGAMGLGIEDPPEFLLRDVGEEAR